MCRWSDRLAANANGGSRRTSQDPASASYKGVAHKLRSDTYYFDGLSDLLVGECIDMLKFCPLVGLDELLVSSGDEHRMYTATTGRDRGGNGRGRINQGGAAEDSET